MTASVDGLVEFLTARLDEREAVARAASPGPWWWDEKFGTDQDNGLALTNAAGTEVVGAYNFHCCDFRDDPNVSDADRAFIALNDPEFVLADIAADRKLIAQYEEAKFHFEAEHDIDGTAKYSDGGVWEFLADLEVWEKVLKIRAERFSGHRDYRQDWQPS